VLGQSLRARDLAACVDVERPHVGLQLVEDADADVAFAVVDDRAAKVVGQGEGVGELTAVGQQADVAAVFPGPQGADELIAVAGQGEAGVEGVIGSAF
jgi:hypothetical protein